MLYVKYIPSHINLLLKSYQLIKPFYVRAMLKYQLSE